MKNTEVDRLGHLGHLSRPAPGAICPLPANSGAKSVAGWGSIAANPFPCLVQ